MSDTFMSTADVANYLQCSVGRVREYIYTHGLKPVGRRGPAGPYMFKREGVDNWLVSCLNSSACTTVALTPIGENDDGIRNPGIPGNSKAGERPVSNPSESSEVGRKTRSARKDSRGNTRRGQADSGADASSIEAGDHSAADYYRGRLCRALDRGAG